MKEKNGYSDLSYFELYDEFKRLQDELKEADQDTFNFLYPYYKEAQNRLLEMSALLAQALTLI